MSWLLSMAPALEHDPESDEDDHDDANDGDRGLVFVDEGYDILLGRGFDRGLRVGHILHSCARRVERQIYATFNPASILHDADFAFALDCQASRAGAANKEVRDIDAQKAVPVKVTIRRDALACARIQSA